MKIETAQLRDFAERYTAAWCSNDPARVAGFFSPNGSLKVNEDAPAVGRNAITAVAQGFMTAFPDMHLLMDDLVIQNDHPVYHWTLIGTNSAPGGTGHRVRISGFEIWRLGADGLISESKGHFDESAYQHQLKHGFVES
jgi:hypothetical protein